MSLMDLVVFPPGCGRIVTIFWGWDVHEAQLRCPDEVGGDIWIWSTRRGLNLSSTKLSRLRSSRKSSSSRKNPHGRAGNRARDLLFSSQKIWPLDHEAGPFQQMLLVEKLMRMRWTELVPIFVLIFDSWWGYLNFSLTQSFRPHYGPVVDSASNKHLYYLFFMKGGG
jgi:hypothetical protein